MIPERLQSPSVGLIPTMPFAPEGQMTEPSVSVPIPIVARSAETPTPVPELDPQGLRSRTYAMFVWPPMPVQPDEEGIERKFAHSERLALPITNAPAAFKRWTMNASGGVLPASAPGAAVVGMAVVVTLALARTGIPSSGRRSPWGRAASAARASALAVGLTVMTACSLGLSFW